MTATATVEEYHPEVVKAFRTFAEKAQTEAFFRGITTWLDEVYIEETSQLRDKFTQFLLSECATPLQRDGASQ